MAHMVTKHRLLTFLFVCGFTYHSRLFHSYGDVRINKPMKGFKFWLMLLTHGHWAVRVLQRATPALTRRIHLLLLSPKTRDIRKCRAVDSRGVTTCFTDLYLSRPWIEPRSLHVRRTLYHWTVADVEWLLKYM